MILGIIIIITITSLTLGVQLYSFLNPFIEQYSYTNNYRKATYIAQSQIEKGLAMQKIRGPGFSGSNINIIQDTTYFSGERNIKEDTGITTIGFYPKTFFLYKDENTSINYNTQNAPISAIPIQYSKATFSIPMLGTGNLCIYGANCDIDGDGISDDIVAGWVINGLYNNKIITILPQEKISYNVSPPQVIMNKDNFLRESLLSNGTGILTFDIGFNPTMISQDQTSHYVVGEQSIKTIEFSQLFGDQNFERGEISFTMINPIVTTIPISNSIINVQGCNVGNCFNLPTELLILEGKGSFGGVTKSIIIPVKIKSKFNSDVFTILF